MTLEQLLDSYRKAVKARTTSQYRGVSWNTDRGKWWARINVNNAAQHLGLFQDEREAAQAYDDAARQWHGA